MQTDFTAEQLADPDVAHSEKILRKCVHCGFCTATCPTYLTLGDELDSPRGRIYLIKDMLENDRPADERTVRHIDRCLSCLACMTTCPSGVNYMHLVDHARAHIHKTYRRPLLDRLYRAMLAAVLPYPSRFRLALLAAWPMRPLAGLIARLPGGKPLASMLALAPRRVSFRTAIPAGRRPRPFESKIAGRIALLSGCAQKVLDPQINLATSELLARLGYEVVVPRNEVCCGALVHHMGREEQAREAARRNIRAWEAVEKDGGLDAIIITTSGCGTTVKDYGHMLRNDPDYGERAARMAALACDISEFLDRTEIEFENGLPDLRIAYHSACSMQHGQRIVDQPKRLLQKAGFRVLNIPEGHLCCGSAGTYNILQPDISTALKQRKIANIEKTQPDAIATGNIGCIAQIRSGCDLPILHTIQLLNWAHGGRKPAALSGISESRN